MNAIETQGPRALSLYWYALAHSRSAKRLAEQDASSAVSVQSRSSALARLVNTLSEQQVIEPPLLGPDDVLGGFQLYRGPAGSPPNPNWTSASLLAFLAVAMRDPGITEDQDPFGWLLTASLGARFVAQLMMDRPSCFYVRSLDDALDGVRLALWDNQLAIAPTAMSLLAMVELREAIEALEAPAVE